MSETPPSDIPSLDDTQPRTPFDDRPLTAAREILPDEEGERRRLPDERPPGTPGCGVFTLILGIVVLFAVVIVALAGAAGWTAGLRESNVHATSTQSAAIHDQMSRIPGDIADGNLVLLDTRLRYVATLAPAAPGLADFSATATALYLTSLPTATLTPSPTLAATETAEATETATPTQEAIVTQTGGGYDLAALLSQAQGEFVAGNYGEAAELAEVVYSLDPDFERTTVVNLLTESLNAQANRYFDAMQPAKGIQIVDRILSLGLFLGDGLSFEADVGARYLNAMANVGIDYNRAIAALRDLIDYGGTGRYYADAVQLLYQQYVRYGDALAADPSFGYCPAAVQYRNAYNLFPSGDATGKLTSADTLCSQATPTFDPLLLGTPGVGAPAPIAPLGVPGT